MTSNLIAGELAVIFLPERGMLGVSLRHRDEELLRRLENLEAAAAKGSTAGIPLLYPWANRLASLRFRFGDREVTLDPASPLLHCDEHGLPIHGVKWAALAWEVIAAKPDYLAARLEWKRPELMAVFPFRHELQMVISLSPESLTLETTITAGDRMPVSFGFHPYFGIPGLPRSQWRLELPALSELALDDNGIPTGEEKPFRRFGRELGDLNLDARFRVSDELPIFSLSGGQWRINVEFLENYRYAQVFAPKDKAFVALEPMTAPTSALTSGRDLPAVEPGEKFRAAFRIGIQA